MAGPRRAAPPRPVASEATDAFVDLLLAGTPPIPVIEALDQRGIWTRVLPEWLAVRCKPQRNAYHRYTVDRHLLEAAANAAALTDRVAPARPARGRRARCMTSARDSRVTTPTPASS